uniref:CUB domain-containing protein n=1 Tax=Romanomermis culicivorax TaxID=13658 RepID=A0A915I2G4_ROMCU
MECKYNIQVKRGFKVLLTVENMTMPCNESYLEIKLVYIVSYQFSIAVAFFSRNGDSDFAPAVGGLLLSRLCRESRVESIKSQSNALYLRFKSEPISSMSRYIFRLKYQQIAEGCGGTLNAIIGGLSAPQFPLPSSQNVDCSWRITVAKGNIVSLRVGRFDSSIPPTVSCWAWGNRLEIRDGPYLTSPLMRRVCHIEESVGVFDSTSNELSVRYAQLAVIRAKIVPEKLPQARQKWPPNPRTVSSSNFESCKLYRVARTCNNIRLRGFYGRLESPGYPGMSHIKRNCSWRIETSLGNTLRLHFTHFDVQDKGPIPCNKTYLQFVPGQIKAVADLSMKNYTSNNIFCNLSFKPSIVYSTSNVIDIKFLAQTNVPSSHFALEWITIGCGGILTDNEGKFTVVNETDNDVEYRACEWTIKAPLGRKILLVVENFIFNGQDNSTGYPILSICDFINGPNAISITSTGDAMFVSMHHAVTTVPVPGGIVFAASYKFIESGCGGILTSSSGFISSPNFPNPYPLGTECNWLIKVKTGYTVQFKFATLDIGPSVANYDCTSRFGDILGTYIELFDGQNASAPLLRRFCGSRAVLIGQTIASTENAMFVRFRTSATDSMETRTGRGFSGNYSVGCGGLLTASGDKRTLESSASHFYSDCQWKIVAQNPGIESLVFNLRKTFANPKSRECCRRSWVFLAGVNFFILLIS